jgi:hypothetical protein
MSVTDAFRNTALDAVGTAVTHVGLADRTLTELTGGTPAYARKTVAWNAAATGQKTQNGALVFDAPAGVEACFAILRTAITAGTDYGYLPLGGFSPMAASFLQATDVFTKAAHGLVNTNQVVVFDIQGAGLAAGFTEGTIYYVVAAATDTFQLSLTSGGAAITSAASMECGVQRVLPATDAAQFTVTIPTTSLVLDGRWG